MGAYTTKTLIGNEFEKYDQKYWDLSGSYPTFK